jgi:succinyldiaminopimelate transaminase
LDWARLPDFPWDTLAPARRRAAEHPGGIIDLSVGTPVDPTPSVITDALIAHANAPGYPTTVGTPELHAAIHGWIDRRLGGVLGAAILPTIGSKEAIATLPWVLGLSGPVVIPDIAYPTYAVGAVAAELEYVATDRPEDVPRASAIWVNSPSNPTGRVLSSQRLAEIITHARSLGIPVLSDECYIELGWTGEPVSILHPEVNGGDVTGIVAVHSLSKRSTMAGYRFGFLAGDPRIIGELLERRKHLGEMVPEPVQFAAAAAYSDDTHVEVQRARYERRRAQLRTAVESAGFTVDHSDAGLYLWITRDEPCWDVVAWFAGRGILVTPGDFYGPRGARHVRVALTATDAAVDSAVERLAV